jgi:glycosyltransferase involved in cell wall biosynthesis
MHEPAMKFSIVTTTLNSSRTIASCMQSVAEQEVDLTHIIIDGASSDTTLKVVQKVGGDHVQVVSEPDQGIYDGMNRGIALARGEILGILNSDDVYSYSEVLQDVQKVFEDPAVDCCYGDLVYVASDDLNKVRRYWRSGSFDDSRFYKGWMPPHPTFFVRREFYDRYGLFDLNLGSAADYEMMLRMLMRHQLRAVYIPRILVRMRMRGASNANMSNRLRANRYDRIAWRKNGLQPRPWTFILKPLLKLGQYVRRPAGLPRISS